LTPYAATRDLARNYNRAGLLALYAVAVIVYNERKDKAFRHDQQWRIRALKRALKETTK